MTDQIALGEIKSGIRPRCRQMCEAFRDGILAGEKPREFVGYLATIFDVQRPAIWKAVRTGGLLPPYAPKDLRGRGRPIGGGIPGYTERRRAKSVALVERAEPDAPRVNRDACPFCATRADVGCRHQVAA